MNKFVGLITGLSLAASATAAFAHHGTSVSYDMDHPWTTDAIVLSFTYANPHPRMNFVRQNERGQSEQFEAELITNPSAMARMGWTRGRSVDALKAGTKVKLTVSTSKANPRQVVVRNIQNAAGEYIVMNAGPPAAAARPGA